MSTAKNSQNMDHRVGRRLYGHSGAQSRDLAIRWRFFTHRLGYLRLRPEKALPRICLPKLRSSGELFGANRFKRWLPFLGISTASYRAPNPPKPRKVSKKSPKSSLGPLSDPTEIPPVSRDRCSNTPVALCSSDSCSIADHRCYTPYRNPKTGLTRGAPQKNLTSEVYRAIGGVARNSIANRTVGH